MEVVLVALITALAAVVPQILTWWQNKKRDEWEKVRHDEETARQESEAAAAAEAAQNAEVRSALVGFVEAASAFRVAVDVSSDSVDARKYDEALMLLAPLRVAAIDALIVLQQHDRSHLVSALSMMLTEFDRIDESKMGSLEHHEACSKALALVRSGI